MLACKRKSDSFNVCSLAGKTYYLLNKLFNLNGYFDTFEEAEEDNIKKDVQVTEMAKQLKLMKKELEARNDEIVNNQSSSLNKLRSEHNREREEFEKREQNYVERLESVSNANLENEKELQELRTKMLKMEMNERDLLEEVCSFWFFFCNYD